MNGRDRERKQLFAFVSEHAARLGVGVEDLVCRDVDEEDGVVGVLEDAVKARLTFTYGRFRPFAFSQVVSEDANEVGFGYERDFLLVAELPDLELADERFLFTFFEGLDDRREILQQGM